MNRFGILILIGVYLVGFMMGMASGSPEYTEIQIVEERIAVLESDEQHYTWEIEDLKWNSQYNRNKIRDIKAEKAKLTVRLKYLNTSEAPKKPRRQEWRTKGKS